MDYRGLVLVGFSALCLTASGLAYQEKKRSDIASGLSRAIAGIGNGCGAGIDTPIGRLRCVQRTSGLFNGH